MREGKGIQALVVLIFTTLTAWLGHLAIPVYVLVGCNVIDYLTGLMAAPKRGEKLSSYKGFNGIAKKVCMWILVGVGAMIDVLITYAGEKVSPDFIEPFIVAIVVALWLAFNEMISILENIQTIGVVLPPFMVRLVEKLRRKTEDVVENTLDDKEGKDDRAGN